MSRQSNGPGDRYARRPGPGRPRHPDILTPAEWRVLELVREGFSNGEIATRLDVSVNTVRTHVSRILAKTGAEDRVALASWPGEPREATRSILERLRARALAPLSWLRWGATSWVASAVLVGAIAVLAVVVIAGLAGLSEAWNRADVISTPPTDVSPAEVAPPLLVYTRLAGHGSTGTENYRRFEVAIYDVGQSETTSSFEVGAVRRDLQDVALGDREIIVNLERELLAFGLDGSPTRVIYDAPADSRVVRPAVSNDGSMVAFTREAEDLSNWTFFIVDLKTQEVLVEIDGPGPDLAKGLAGTPAAHWWSQDDERVLLSGITYSGDTSRHGAVTVGGELIVYEPRSLHLFDPTGRYALHGDGSCTADAYREFWVTDLTTGSSRLIVEDTGAVLTPLEWAPDGSALLYEVRTGDPENCEALDREWGEPETTLLVELDSGQSREADQLELRQDWYGERALTFSCGFPPETPAGKEVPGRRHALDRQWSGACTEVGALGFEYPIATWVLLDGATILNGEALTVVGFIELPE